MMHVVIRSRKVRRALDRNGVAQWPNSLIVVYEEQQAVCCSGSRRLNRLLRRGCWSCLGCGATARCRIRCCTAALCIRSCSGGCAGWLGGPLALDVSCV